MNQFRFFSVSFSIATILYAFLLPPFEIHDEIWHFAKASQLAFLSYPSVREASQPGAMIPESLAQLRWDWPPDPPDHGAHKRSIVRLLNKLRAPASPTRRRIFATFGYLSYPPILYIPQAVGLRLGRAFHLSPLGQFYAGRLAGALVAVGLVLLAATLMPFGGRTLLSLAILPGVASQLASYSADSMIFGLTFLATAIFINALSYQTRIQKWCISLLIPVLALAKGVYLPIALAAMGELRAWNLRNIRWMLCWMVAGVVSFAVWFGIIAKGEIVVQHYVSHINLQQMVTAPHQQMKFMYTHPITSASIILSTMVQRLPVYFVGIVGRFGAFNVLLPIPIYGIALFFLLFASFSTDASEELPSLLKRFVWLAIVICVAVLIHIALYLTATAPGEPYVEGVQGRYFIPILPLFILSFRYFPGTRVARIADALVPFLGTVLMITGLATAASAYWRW